MKLPNGHMEQVLSSTPMMRGLEKDFRRIRLKYANMQLPQITYLKNEIQNPVNKNKIMENKTKLDN